MDQKGGCDTPDSGIFSPNGRSDSSSNSVIGSLSVSANGQAFGQNSRRTSFDSGISTPMGKSGKISSPVDAEELKTALTLQLTVSAQGGPPRSMTISANEPVDKLIEHSARICGLGTGADVYLMNGTETLQRGSNKKVKQTKLSNGSHLQLMTRCHGG